MYIIYTALLCLETCRRRFTKYIGKGSSETGTSERLKIFTSSTHISLFLHKQIFFCKYLTLLLTHVVDHSGHLEVLLFTCCSLEEGDNSVVQLYN